MKLLTLTGRDFEEFAPCHTNDGKTPPAWWSESGTMLDILQDGRISDEDKLWAFTCGVQFVSDKSLQDRILRLFACKCLRSTPISDGRVVWDLLTPCGQNVVYVSEHFARGEATQEELTYASRNAKYFVAIYGGRDAWKAAKKSATKSARKAARTSVYTAFIAANFYFKAAARAAQVGFAIEIIENEIKEDKQ